MCLTFEARLARQRGEEVVTDFSRLYPEHLRKQQGLPARDEGARRSLKYLAPPAYEEMVRWGEDQEAKRRQVKRDIRTHGQPAWAWYTAMSPDYLPTLSATRGLAPRRLDRRLSCGRPARRRSSSRSTRAGPSDSDLDPPPRSPVALEGVAG
jgi:hypothetical protein